MRYMLFGNANSEMLGGAADLISYFDTVKDAVLRAAVGGYFGKPLYWYHVYDTVTHEIVKRGGAFGGGKKLKK